MAEQIQALFCDPPIAVARLGGSTTPLECCVWEEPPNPRADGATVLVPDWSLNVLPDGSIEPHKANTIRFRDGPLDSSGLSVRRDLGEAGRAGQRSVHVARRAPDVGAAGCRRHRCIRTALHRRRPQQKSSPAPTQSEISPMAPSLSLLSAVTSTNRSRWSRSVRRASRSR